jgi:ribonuclease HI
MRLIRSRRLRAQKRKEARNVSDVPVVITPPQLLRAIADHEELQATCAALPGMTRERAQRLLRGIALALQRPDPVAAPASPPPIAARPPIRPDSKLIIGNSELKAITPSNGAIGKVLVYSDGASRGNPGPAGAGAVLLDEKGGMLKRLGKYIGRETNNIAEYQGLLLGLRGAIEFGAREIEIRADSELMIKQLKGEYRVKNEGLKPLFTEAQSLMRRFEKVKLRHVPREENTLADEMSNRAIDEKM